MKNMMYTLIVGFLVAATTQGAVVYQDTFDNDTLVTNTGMGGGAANTTILDHYWQDDGNATLITPVATHTRRALLYSINSFQHTGGLKLTVTYSISDTGNGAENEFSFGLMSDDTDLSTYGTSDANADNPFAQNTGIYSLGVDVTTDNGLQGLNVANGSSVSHLDDYAFAAGTGTVVIEIAAGGAWGYSVNGITQGSGTIAGFDLTKSYHFAAYGRDDVSTRSIHSVTIESITNSGDPDVESAWTGVVDSNWNVAGNWDNSLTPGSAGSAMALLQGSNVNVAVATPIETTNSFNMMLSDEAQLTVSWDMSRCMDLFLGATAGGGGGHVIQGADITVSDDLRIGNDPSASSDSSYTIKDGSLVVGDELYMDQGLLSVDSSEASLTADRMTLTENAHLKFDFDPYGTSPIVVSNALTIANGASLEIDLRGYTMGSNEIELFQFGAISGTFDAADVTIIGLNGGALAYGANELTLTIEDEVQDSSSTLWFKAGAISGLEVNTGRMIRDLTSPALMYTEMASGEDLVYSISWNGTDFDDDGLGDALSFDLRVEGFSGSSYTYSTNEASSTASVGNSAPVTIGWGIGSDLDLDAGESLRFSVENVSCSAVGYTANLDGFVAIYFDEVSGHTHQIIIGEGDELDAFKTNTGIDYGLSAAATATVTSAGSALDPALHVSSVGLKISIIDLENPNQKPAVSDVSSYPTGPQMGLDYAAETNFLNYPEFSWDRVPRWASMNGTPSAAQAQSMADDIQIIGFGGFEGEANTIAHSALIKQYNPHIKTLFYLNTFVNFYDFIEASDAFDTNEWNRFTLDANGERVYDKIRSYYEYNHDHPQMREWWVDLMVEMASQPEIDGVFIDKCGVEKTFLNKDGDYEAPASGAYRSYYDLWSRAPVGTLILGNSLRNEREGGGRAAMQFLSGSYMERWQTPYANSPMGQTEADAKCVSIAVMREAALKGKILMPALQDYLTNEELDLGEIELLALIRERVTLPMAYYLIMAEKYSYFRYQPDQAVSRPEYVWNPTDYVDELTRPLGPPLGPPVKDGYVYTRSFEHVDVWLNVETDEALLAWDSVDSDGDGLDDLWEYRNFGGVTNAVANANPDGDDYTNLEEFMAGLNPNLPESFEISGRVDGESIQLEWDAVSNRIYNVYWSSNLVHGFEWVGSNLVNGLFIDSTVDRDEQGFYRIEVGLE